MKYNSYLEVCCQELEIAGECPEDSHLRHFLQLQKLADEICDVFGYRDRYETTTMGPERIQLTVKEFSARLHALCDAFPREATHSGALMLGWLGVRTFLYEIVFHVDVYDATETGTQAQDVWRGSSVRMNLLLGCLEAAKEHCDYFINFPVNGLLAASSIEITRVAYSTLAIGFVMNLSHCFSYRIPITKLISPT